MNTQFWLVQAFNGISYGALLFLVGSGLSLIFGVMRIVNLAHGSYFLLGGYVALSVIGATGSWALSLPVAALAVAPSGCVMERLFLRSKVSKSPQRDDRRSASACSIALGDRAAGASSRRRLALSSSSYRGRAPRIVYFLLSRVASSPIETDVLRQVLLTVGFAFLFQQAALDIWGGNNMDINPPGALTQSIVVGGNVFSALPGIHDRDRLADRHCALAGDGKDPHGRRGARHRR